MPRYRFDLDNNGQPIPGDEPIEYADLRDAKEAATKTLVEVMRNALPNGNHHVLTMTVRDEGGESVFHASLRFDAEAPAAPLSAAE
jgi:hypothetical protein